MEAKRGELVNTPGARLIAAHNRLRWLIVLLAYMSAYSQIQAYTQSIGDQCIVTNFYLTISYKAVHLYHSGTTVLTCTGDQ